jgi:excinuclease UvrABC helicase subunit UvrB
MRVGGDAFDDGPVSDEGNQKRTNRRSRTDPEELRAAFKLAWDNRFQGTGKEVSAPDVDEMMAEELCPEIVKETLSKFIVDEDLKLVNQAKIKMVELSLEAAIREEDYDEAARLRDERARLRARDPMYAHGDLVKQFR